MQHTLKGLISFASGQGHSIESARGVAFGLQNTLTGASHDSLSAGRYNSLNALTSYAFGTYLTTNRDNQFAIGHHNLNRNYYILGSTGQNTISKDIYVKFVIGNGTNEERSNSLEILENGVVRSLAETYDIDNELYLNSTSNVDQSGYNLIHKKYLNAKLSPIDASISNIEGSISSLSTSVEDLQDSKLSAGSIKDQYIYFYKMDKREILYDDSHYAALVADFIYTPTKIYMISGVLIADYTGVCLTYPITNFDYDSISIYRDSYVWNTHLQVTNLTIYYVKNSQVNTFNSEELALGNVLIPYDDSGEEKKLSLVKYSLNSN